MAAKTNIEWTGYTWNPLKARLAGRVGWHCCKVSAGCKNCYAERWNQSGRFGMGTGAAYSPLAKVETFVDRREMTKPLRWRKPRLVFPCSMTDMFGDWVDPTIITNVFEIMRESLRKSGSIFQVLTKRPERAVEVVDGFTRRGLQRGDNAEAFDGVWCGVSVENQTTVERLRVLRHWPACHRWASFEPLLGPIDLRALSPCTLDWAVIGGESGPNARECRVEWIEGLAAQLSAAGVDVFVKQLGTNVPGVGGVGKRKSPELWPASVQQFRRLPVAFLEVLEKCRKL